jgi:imidazolonepropionase-like amidohydrolase
MIRSLFAPLFVFAFGFTFAHSAWATSSIVAYENGRWWSGASFVPGTRYVAKGVFVQAPARPSGRKVDLHGGFVVPPFADAHNHMAGAPSAVNASAETAGIFYLMNPNVLASTAPGLRAALHGPQDIDVLLSMGGITAPGGHPEKLYVDVLRKYVYASMQPEDFIGDAFHYVTSLEDIDPVLDRLVSQHAQFVKIMLLFSEEFERRKDDPAYRGSRGLDPKLVPAIVAAAHRRGLRVAAHIETAADFRVAVAAGVDEAAHMPGYLALAGPMSMYEITDADAGAAARARTAVVATASVALSGEKSRIAAVQAMQRANLQKLKAAGVPLLIGTDGAADAAILEARYLIDLGIFTPRQALASLSETTPQFIFPGRKIGVLKPGYEASFLALTGDPTVDFDAVTHIELRVKQGVPLADLAVTHVAVLSMQDDHVDADQTVLIANDRIIAIGRDLPVAPAARVIDGRGKFAIPGLWDMHTHILSEALGTAAIDTLAAMLRHGIVGVREMGSTVEELRRFRETAAAMNADSLPEVIASGPVVNGPSTPWSRVIEDHVETPAGAKAEVAKLAAAGSQFIKIYSGVDSPTYAALVAAAHERGMVVAGHLPFDLDLVAAVNAGQRSIEHMEVSLSKSCGRASARGASERWLSAFAKDVSARDAEELALREERDPARCRAVLQRMAAHSVWWTPTLVLDFARGCDSSGPALDKPRRDLHQRALQAELDDVAQIHAAGIRLLAGTDAPSPCTAPVLGLWHELALFVRAGLSRYEALKAATLEPAVYLGRRDAGVLKPGNVADMVVLNANPLEAIEAVRDVAAVIKAGHIVKDTS